MRAGSISLPLTTTVDLVQSAFGRMGGFTSFKFNIPCTIRILRNVLDRIHLAKHLSGVKIIMDNIIPRSRLP
jgi:hypothetical protein